MNPFDDRFRKILAIASGAAVDDRVRKALAIARETAQEEEHDFVAPPHILLGVLAAKAPEVDLMLRACGVDAQLLASATRQHLRKCEWANTHDEATRKGSELPYTSTLKQALKLAMREAMDQRYTGVNCGLLLLGVLQADELMAATLALATGLDLDNAREALMASLKGETPEPPAAPDESVWFIEVDPESDTPIYEQIVSAVEEAVATRRLLPGERLPTVRELAQELGTAPGTVARAYRALEIRGILVTEGARGTRVAERADEHAGNGELRDALEGLLRPVVVAAFHMGAGAKELRAALDGAMRGIMGDLA